MSEEANPPKPWEKRWWTDAYGGFRYGELIGWIVGYGMGIIAGILTWWLFNGGG